MVQRKVAGILLINEFFHQNCNNMDKHSANT